MMFYFFFHEQNTMNQEKLAKLQAQVRIGGKVQSAIFFFFIIIII